MDFKLPTSDLEDLVPTQEEKQVSQQAKPNLGSAVSNEQTKNKYEPVVPVKPINVGGGNKKGLAVVVSILVVILLAGAGAFAYFYSISNSSEAIIGQAFINMSELDSLEYKTNISLSAEVVKTDSVFIEAGQKQGIDLMFSGKFDNRNGLKSSGLMDLEIDGSAFGSSEDKYNARLNFVGLDEKMYLQLASLTLPDMVSQMIPIDLATIYSQWVEVDVTQKTTKFEVDDLDKLSNLSEEDQKKLEDIYWDYQFINIIQSSDDGGLRLFKVSIDGLKMFEAAKKANEVVFHDAEFDYNDVPEELIEQLSNIDISLWIGKKDNLVHKAQLLFNEKINIDEENIYKLDIDLSVEYSNFNDTFDITVPTNFITSDQLVEEVMAEMMMGFSLETEPVLINSEDYESSYESDNESDYDTDGDGLNDWLETTIGTNFLMSDSDGDGFDDKDELIGGFDPTSSGRLWEVDWTVSQKRALMIGFYEMPEEEINAKTDADIEKLFMDILKISFGSVVSE